MLRDCAFQEYIVFGVLLTPSGSYKKAFAKAEVMPEARQIYIPKYAYKLNFVYVALINTLNKRDKFEKIIIICKKNIFLYENANF